MGSKDASPAASTSSAPAQSNTITLTPSVMSSFRVGKVFKDQHIKPGHSFTSFSYNDAGDLLLTAADDDTMQVFDINSGTHKKVVKSGKYGCDLARFTHTRKSCLHASTKGDDHAIRYLSLHDDNYIRYFQGHQKRVSALEVSPMDDTFLSASADDAFFLWDVRTAGPTGTQKVAGQPTVSYDPTGVVFCVTMTTNQSQVLMYDARNYSQGPFGSTELYDTELAAESFAPVQPTITSSATSNDGTKILLGTSSGVHYIMNAIEFNIEARLKGHEALEKGASSHARSGAEVSWTPDGRYVVSGSQTGQILIWDVSPPEGSEEAANRPPPGPQCTLTPIATLDGHHGRSTRVVSFNPRSAMFASGATELALWLPKLD